MKFKLEIELGNEAMQTGLHIADLLRDLAGKLEDAAPDCPPPRGPFTLRDLNGNRVGFAETTKGGNRE